MSPPPKSLIHPALGPRVAPGRQLALAPTRPDIPVGRQTISGDARRARSGLTGRPGPAGGPRGVPEEVAPREAGRPGRGCSGRGSEV